MADSTLVAHSGTIRVPEAVVRAEPRPAFTDSWHPFSHAEVIDAMEKAATMNGFEIGRRQYSMRPGKLMFAAWDLARIPKTLDVQPTKEFGLSIGFRHGIDKSLSIGLCAGERVFVCDNLVLSGDVVLFRKHTGDLEFEEIVDLANEAFLRIAPQFRQVIEWHERLKNVKLTTQQTYLLLVAAMRHYYPAIVGPTQVEDFYRLYFAEDSKYSRTLHGFHGAITEMWKDTTLVNYEWRTKSLVTFIDHEAPKILDLDKKSILMVPFSKIEQDASKEFTEVRVEKKKDAKAIGKEIKEAVRKKREEKKEKSQEKAQAKAEKTPVQGEGGKADRPAKRKPGAKKEESLPKSGDPGPKAISSLLKISANPTKAKPKEVKKARKREAKKRIAESMKKTGKLPDHLLNVGPRQNDPDLEI
jgi:hypothetical protein